MKKFLVLLLALCMFATSAMAAVNETGLPIATEGESFTILVDDSGLPEDKIILPMLEEQTGVKVNVMSFPYQTALERMGIMLNSGDYPEVIGGWLLGKQDILDLSADGTFIPLDEIFAAYCPNIMEILSNDAVRQAYTLPDGHIYTIPYVVAEPLATFKPYINTVWLERLGLDMPETTEELKQVLIAFRDEDANGNGDPDDEIPFSADPNNFHLGMMAGYFGTDASGNSTYPYYELVDGKLRFSAATEEYKKFLEWMHELYEEDLLDPELYTQDLAMWKAKGGQDLYGVSIAYGSSDFLPLVLVDNSYYTCDFAALPVLTSPDCDEPIFHRNSYGSTMFLTQVALTDKCDEETAIMICRWFDNTFTSENSAQLNWGPLGVTITKTADGVYQEVDKSDWDQATKDKYTWGNYYMQSLPKYGRNDKLITDPNAPKEFREADEADKVVGPYLNERIPNVWISDEDANNRAALLATDINTYVKEQMAQFIKNGVGEWDAYVAQLETYGLSELTEIYAGILDVEIYE